MQYKYVKNDNYENFSSGRVLLHKSGYPNFPVRLAQEIFCRCLSYLSKKDDLSVYDPLCGGGYLLTVLGLLNPLAVSHIIGSDIDEDAVKLAGDNFNMLTVNGMEKRKEHLRSLNDRYKKQNYSEAIKSAGLLSDIVAAMNIKTYAFLADALKSDYRNLNIRADVIITDVPYGNLVSWQANDELSRINSLLDNIIPCLNTGAVVAVCSDKAQKIKNKNYTRLEKQQIGKRKFEILKLN